MADEAQTLYERLGGRGRVEALAYRFYEVMEEREPELARMHRLDEQGRIASEPRERFALFLVGWLGGPAEYVTRHGHPRLRMRHGHVQVNEAMRDAWVRCMSEAMRLEGVEEESREYLEARFWQVADFMRNVPG